MSAYTTAHEALDAYDTDAEIVGADGHQLRGCFERAEWLIERLRPLIAPIHPDYQDDQDNVRDAHHVNVIFDACNEQGDSLFTSDLILTPAQAVGMFDGIGRVQT